VRRTRRSRRPLRFWHDESVDNPKTACRWRARILQTAGYRVVDGKLHYPDGVKEALSRASESAACCGIRMRHAIERVLHSLFVLWAW